MSDEQRALLVTKPLTRTRAIAVVAATAACLLGVTQLPADAKGGGNPRRTTTTTSTMTTSTTTPPPIPTSLLMDVHTQPGEVRCDWNGCQQATNMVARLSEGPDIGPGIPDRVVFMTFGNGTGCTATTDMIGWAECTAWGTPDVAAFGTFSGDATYEPTSTTWHVSEDWDRGL